MHFIMDTLSGCAGSKYKYFFWCLPYIVSIAPVFGQTDSLKSITRQFNQYSGQALPEKLFLHLDRPLYVTGETMWFKIYAVDGTFHKPLPVSKIAYVEVLDQEQKPVLQGKIALQDATGRGSFVLPASLASGNYVVRGYTNWMKNFGPDYFFQCPVTIVNTFTSLGLKPGQDSAAYDIQFFPEGGNLVKGIPNTVAFKVTDKFGQGLDAEGTLLDQQGKLITPFKTLKFGLGRFSFTPTETVSYTATITLANKQILSQKLPAVYEQGVVMHLAEESLDKIKITVQTNTPDLLTSDVLLLGHARQQISVSATIRLTNGQAEFSVNKKDLAEGISHFTLFNGQKQPLCERLYFRRPTQQLIINAATDKIDYTTRHKVSVQFATTTVARQAVPANLSLAVYRLDSLPTASTPNINSYIWLTSDLKGKIENPDYYFTDTSLDAAEATDNLMLTHGWRRFRWETVFSNKADSFEFLPELNGHLIQGRLTQNTTGKVVPGIPTFLASPSRHIRLYNSVSKENGLIQFDVKDFYGPREIILQTNTQQDSTYHFEIFNPFSQKYTTKQLTPFTLSERYKTDIAQRHLQMQVQRVYFKKHTNVFKPAFTDSLAFYGQPDEKYLLDDFTRFRVMEEVMREYVPGVQVRIRKDGFHFMVFDNVNKSIFHENPMVLLDGVPVFNINKLMAVDPLKIQKLEVITSRYLQGTLTYNGLVSYTTYKGDLEGYQLNPRTFVQEYEGLQLQREFYAPRYETISEKQSRLPDLRNLLYWNPDLVSTTNANQKLEFYTSDKAGKYLVVMQGISPDGRAGNTSFSFEVKQAL